jgi:hypothetical protein
MSIYIDVKANFRNQAKSLIQDLQAKEKTRIHSKVKQLQKKGWGPSLNKQLAKMQSSNRK